MPENRRILPQRRRCETFEIAWGGIERRFAITSGFYDEDGALGEVFISGCKSGEPLESIARDGAVVLSLALQHGCRLDTIASAITRDDRDASTSLVGAVIDRLVAAPSHGPKYPPPAEPAPVSPAPPPAPATPAMEPLS